MKHQTKIEILKRFKNESQFRAFLIELLIRMGYDDVIENHGIREKGKDIIAKYNHSIDGDEINSFVVKYGKLTGKAVAIQEIISQVNESLHLDYQNSKGLVLSINKVKIVTNDTITEEAKEKLLNHREISNKSNVVIWINLDLINFIDNSYPEFWESEYFIDSEKISNRNQLYGYAAQMLIDSKEYRASNVGPTFLHPDWYFKRANKNKTTLSLDVQLKQRVFNFLPNIRTKIILRNVKERYETKIDLFIEKNERDKFKKDLLSAIEKLKHQLSIEFICTDIGFNDINLIFDHHIINTYRTKAEAYTHKGFLISRPSEVLNSKNKFDEIFHENNNGKEKELATLIRFVNELWS